LIRKLMLPRIRWLHVMREPMVCMRTIDLKYEKLRRLEVDNESLGKLLERALLQLGLENKL